MALSTLGKHRRARTGMNRGTRRVFGVAAVTVAGVGVSGSTAGAQTSAATGQHAVTTSLAEITEAHTLLHGGIVVQAGAQMRTAADEENEEVERAARRKAVKEAGRRAAAERAAAKKAADKTAPERASRGEGGRTDLGVAPEPGGSGWTTPVASVSLSAQYGQPGSWSAGYHTGVDFVTPVGTAVRAVGAGTVVRANFDGAYGYNIVIRHTDGRYTQYAHLSSLGVTAGQAVSGGQQIGLSGATGNVTGPHVHFEVRSSAEYGSDMNPLAYLRSHGVRI